MEQNLKIAKTIESEDELCGCKIKGLYENSLFTGTTQYFNQKWEDMMMTVRIT